MKSLLTSCTLLLAVLQLSLAGESKIYPMEGPDYIQCCSQNLFSVDVENINPTFAISEIYGKWIVKRMGVVIYEEEFYPPDTELFPGEIVTFDFEIPMQFLNLDGLLEVRFEFHSEFDLNPDPSETNITEVEGCGITKGEAIDVFLAALSGTAEQNNASMYIYDQLLKPGTVIRGTGSDIFSLTLDAFTWFATIYDPLGRFEQPVVISALNSNTEEIETFQLHWPPTIDNVPFYPDFDADGKIFGSTTTADPPPCPLDFVPVPSIPMDSVCAVLVSGSDKKVYIQESFDHDVDYMKGFLTHHPKGPGLPESNVLIRRSATGYNRDSLQVDFQNLKDKYNKVYFFYSGHGSATGKMCIGKDSTEWMTYNEFTQKLFDSGANKYCIMIDACHSGKLIESICADPHLPGIDVEVVTSSSADKISGVAVYKINDMNQWYGKFISQVFYTANKDSVDQNEDGKASFSELFDKVVEANYNNVNIRQCPVKKNIQNYTEGKIAEMIYKHGELFYGPKVHDATLRISPVVYPQGTQVHSFDMVNHYTLPFAGHVAWLDWEPNAMFAKPLSYLFVDPANDNVEFHDEPEFWPQVTPPSLMYDPFNPDHLFHDGLQTTIGEPANTIYQPVLTTPGFDERDVAILVTGSHPDARFEEATNQMLNEVTENLVNETLGYPFHPNSIVTMNGVTGHDLLSFIQGLQDAPHSWNKVYFFYTGNISSNGMLALGNELEEWKRVFEIWDLIDRLNALDTKIIIDGSYAANTITPLPEFSQNNQFDIFTSTNKDKVSHFTFYVDELLNPNTVISPWLYGLLSHYGNPAVERDGQAGTSFKEAYDGMYISKPMIGNKELFEILKPLNYSQRIILFEGAEPGSKPFISIDLTMEISIRTSDINVNAIQELNPSPKTTSSSAVFEISPVRQWNMNGTFDLDPSLKSNLIFQFYEPMDIMSTTQGVLGLVSRASSADEWEAYYPTVYDEIAKTITAQNVTDLREWAIARVQEPSGLNNEIAGITDIVTFPNPAVTNIQLSFKLENAKDLAFNLIDLNGRIVYTRPSALYADGEHKVQFEVSSLASGLYVIEMVEDVRKKFVPFVR